MRKDWYAAHAIEVWKLRRGRQGTFTVWESVLLVLAQNHAEAKRLARDLMRARAVDDKSATVDGRPAKLKFLGIRKTVRCEASLPIRTLGSRNGDRLDGAEVTYSTYRVRGAAALARLVRGDEVNLTYES